MDTSSGCPPATVISHGRSHRRICDILFPRSYAKESPAMLRPCIQNKCKFWCSVLQGLFVYLVLMPSPMPPESPEATTTGATFRLLTVKRANTTGRPHNVVTSVVGKAIAHVVND